MARSTPDPALLALRERIRGLLADEAARGEVREVRMFGGVSFMVRDKLTVSAGRDGVLLVRVDELRHDDLAARTGAHTGIMGERDMGPGWIQVESAAVSADLEFWVTTALEHNAART